VTLTFRELASVIGGFGMTARMAPSALDWSRSRPAPALVLTLAEKAGELGLKWKKLTRSLGSEKATQHVEDLWRLR
jgi:hypothetical protein